MIINNTTTKGINIVIVFFIILGIFSTFSVAFATERHAFHKHFKQRHHHYHRHHHHHHKKMKNINLALKLSGTGTMYKRAVPGLKDEAMCFDVDLIDLKSRRMVGTATDCLSDIKSQPEEKGGGVGLVGTTFIHLPGGSLTVRGNVSVQPVIEPTVSASGQTITHITGASGGGNGVIEGTGMFAGSAAQVRLSGMVDMSGFKMEVGDPLHFNCLFIIDVNLSSD